ncbi:MAG: type II toxin-antitoxin system HicB family antitoxin [Ignavibacteria bacterium]|jgi:predicted RNase H-like HicB family nuclease|nr:type II toxin-antitoxin system HicB family antitoxin [Ignavibacteria bacterium]MCU7501894.1 type II toxin-antitoxin system HicB family antitoxin [Ignavibacteria bacterium]MCU7514760.1 type II toxin-antitoxin system HicB family antitoxin [Ignavibacteria bacterium]
MKYLIVVENTKTGFSAYSPDLEGCVATGFTKEEVEESMLQALRAHLKSLKDEGYLIPEPKCYSKYIEVPDKMPEEFPL